jgi:beta-phosphoglucomutase
MQTKAVIFDFDGVIVDTEPLHYKSFQEILEPVGLGYSWEDYVAVFMGFDDRDAFQEAYHRQGKSLSGPELELLINRKAAVFQKVINDGVTAYPGVIELINHLHQNRIPLAICSGALRSDIEPILAQLGITDRFSHIVTAEDVPHSKPDPTCYKQAYEKLYGTFPELTSNPERCIAIEDTPAGIASAKGANLEVVAVTNSYPAASLTKADRIVARLDELINSI